MRRAPYVAPVFAFAAAGALLAAPLGYRYGLWNLNGAFALLRSAAVAAAAGALLCLAAGAWALRLRDRRLLVASLAGLVLGAAACAVPWASLRLARGLPAIHDISTDTGNPPEFVALRAARLAAPNGLEYGGRHVAEDQRAAYPDIAPITYAASPAAARERCLEIARGLGWEIAPAMDPLLVEATDRTLFFGFRDDVAIRITPLADGRASRIDLRSVSRVGGSDFGANAKRVRRFLAELGGRGS